MLVLLRSFHLSLLLMKKLRKKKLLLISRQYSSYRPYYPELKLERLGSVVRIDSIRRLPSLGNDDDGEQSRIRRLKVGILPFRMHTLKQGSLPHMPLSVMLQRQVHRMEKGALNWIAMPTYVSWESIVYYSRTFHQRGT